MGCADDPEFIMMPWMALMLPPRGLSVSLVFFTSQLGGTHLLSHRRLTSSLNAASNITILHLQTRGPPPFHALLSRCACCNKWRAITTIVIEEWLELAYPGKDVWWSYWVNPDMNVNKCFATSQWIVSWGWIHFEHGGCPLLYGNANMISWSRSRSS